MFSQKLCLPLFIVIIYVYKSSGLNENSNVPNNLNQVLGHLLSKSSSDINLAHNISYLPQIFQGTIILNINYPESKSAINIYNAPNQRSKVCNCNSNMASEHSECNCYEKQNFSNFADADDNTNKDFKNNANKELEHVLQNDENNLDEFSNDNNETDTNMLTLNRVNFQIAVKGNHDENETTPTINIENKFENNTLLSDFFTPNEIAANLLSMALSEINTVEKNNITNLSKETRKIDRLRDLNKTNSTVSYLQKKEENIPLELSRHNSSSTNVLSRNAIIQESIINFQQYIPPLFNNSFMKNTSDSDVGMNSGLDISCTFPAKCVYLMYCTVDGEISNSPVILNAEEEKLRNKLPNCADGFTGRTGKCCMDPLSSD